MLIPNQERSARYYGAIAFRCGQSLKMNPYVKEDPRKEEYEKGYKTGIIEDGKGGLLNFK